VSKRFDDIVKSFGWRLGARAADRAIKGAVDGALTDLEKKLEVAQAEHDKGREDPCEGPDPVEAARARAEERSKEREAREQRAREELERLKKARR